jgi:hypothetical protein
MKRYRFIISLPDTGSIKAKSLTECTPGRELVHLLKKKWWLKREGEDM